MQTGDHGFEHIMSAVLEQKQVWEKLQGENRDLRQQLLDLRAGRGIFIEIQNQRFELAWDQSKSGSGSEASAQGKRSQASKSSKSAPHSSSMSSSGVLEEMLLDELSSAMKNRIGGEGKSGGPLNEEQKATLRRELSGSFLLE